MKKSKKKKKKKRKKAKLPRNIFALDAKSRKAGVIKHKLEPKKGSRKKDYVLEYED